VSLEKLTQFLETSKHWSRLKTSVPGVFVLKLPAYRRAPPRLAVELNPVDAKGKPQKRRGLVLRSHSELEDVKTLFQYEKLTKLMKMLEAVNPQPETDRQRKREDVIQL
jgi:hypothetical protein